MSTNWNDFNVNLIADMRANAGKPTSGPFLGRPVLILTTTGAKSGVKRETPLVYFGQGDDLQIIASKGGSDTHPAWYHNLRAHPVVTFGGIPMRATIVDDETERERLWTLADRVFPAFASYRDDATRTNRSIPIIQLVQPAPGDVE